MPGQGGMQQQNRIGGNNLMQPLQRMGSMGKMPLLGGPPQQMRRSGGILQPSQRGNILGERETVNQSRTALWVWRKGETRNKTLTDHSEMCVGTHLSGFGKWAAVSLCSTKDVRPFG